MLFYIAVDRGHIGCELTLLKDYDDWIGTWTYSELDWTWVIDDIGFTFFIIAWSALKWDWYISCRVLSRLVIPSCGNNLGDDLFRYWYGYWLLWFVEMSYGDSDVVDIIDPVLQSYQILVISLLVIGEIICVSDQWSCISVFL